MRKTYQGKDAKHKSSAVQDPESILDRPMVTRSNLSEVSIKELVRFARY